MSTEADQSDGAPDPDREDEDLRLLRSAVARLMEHFDTVHVFATRHLGDDEGTAAVQYGGGNWYARRGQIGNWIRKQDADAAAEGY